MKDIFNRPLPVPSNKASIGEPPYKETGWVCLDRAKKRMSITVPGTVMEDSFNSALNSADGVEIFTCHEQDYKLEHKAIVKNLKDNWRQDIKDISFPNSADIIVGDTVRWERYGYRWIIVSQDLIYKDYFRGEMYRANYKINWKNEHGKPVFQWGYVRGPVETKNKNEQTTGNTIIGKGNDTLEIIVGRGRNRKDIESLKRYRRIFLAGRTWDILVIDDISSPNIIRMACIENYTNSQTDDMVIGLPNGKIDFVENEKNNGIKIIGPQVIKTKVSTKFYVVDENEEPVNGTFAIDSPSGKAKILTDFGGGEVSIVGHKIGEFVKISFVSEDGVEAKTIELKTVSPLS